MDFRSEQRQREPLREGDREMELGGDGAFEPEAAAVGLWDILRLPICVLLYLGFHRAVADYRPVIRASCSG